MQGKLKRRKVVKVQSFSFTPLSSFIATSMGRATAVLSYTLSRVAFVATHVVFAYWLNYLLNDPLNLGLVTLDAKPPLPYVTFCQLFLYSSFFIVFIWLG